MNREKNKTVVTVLTINVVVIIVIGLIVVRYFYKKRYDISELYMRITPEKIERDIKALKPRYQQAIKENRLLDEKGSELAIQNRHLYDKKNELEPKKEIQKKLEGKNESQKQQNNGFSMTELKKRSKEIEAKRKESKQQQKKKTKELER